VTAESLNEVDDVLTMLRTELQIAKVPVLQVATMTLTGESHELAGGETAVEHVTDVLLGLITG
jgi:hypothetical protein